MTVVIVGGASGIGLATAELLEEQHAGPFIVDIKKPAGDWPFTRFIHWDVRMGETDYLARTFHPERPIDGLVYTAGVQHAGNIDDSDLEAMWSVNYRGAWLVTRALVPLMREDRFMPASIVYVSSIAGLRYGGPGLAEYAATKAALIAYARSLALELAPEIRVNVVCPGWTNTRFNEPLFKAAERAGTQLDIESVIPMRRQAEPLEIAEGIAWLLSPESAYVTGSTLVMDGGLTLH